jgi:nitronate monooxygenase
MVLLSAGAGGNTGWVNGLAFVRAVREMYDGPLGLAGGISDGAALLAAQVLGCDFALMGTRFIATTESLASAEYQAMLVSSRIDDIALTRGISGLEANFLRPSLLANDLDPEELAKPLSAEQARERFGAYSANLRGPRRWLDLWSAGHTVSAVRQTHSVRNLVDSVAEEYRQARSRLQQVTAADTVMMWTEWGCRDAPPSTL